MIRDRRNILIGSLALSAVTLMAAAGTLSWGDPPRSWVHAGTTSRPDVVGTMIDLEGGAFVMGGGAADVWT